MTRRLWVCGCLVLATLSGCSKQPAPKARVDAGPVSVTVSPVTTRQVQRVVESVGTLFPYEEVIVSAEIEGRVGQVNADLGDRVQANQPLVVISDEEQRYLLAQTEAQLRQAMERLGLKNEDDRVRDVRETSEVRRAQADLGDAEQRYKRMKSLVDQGIGSASDLDQAQARFKAMEATYDQSMNQIRNLIQDVERNKASLALQRKKLRDTRVLAPFAGAVKEKSVTVGQYVSPNAPLFTLVKLDPIRLRIEVPERMAPWIRTGQSVDVTMEAFGDRPFTGKIWRISPTVDQSKRTFIVEALIPNGQGELKPGSYAKARVPTSRTEQVVLAPARALNYVFGSNKAYVVRGEQIEARDVKLGDRFQGMVEVLDGVSSGEQLATSQLARLDSGVKVRVMAQTAKAGDDAGKAME